MKFEKERMQSLLGLPQLTQIGIVVRDLDKALASYKESFFDVPFLRITDFQKLGYHETYYKGEPEAFNATFAFSRLGTMEVEIIQPVKGRSIYKDFLDAGREGLHHLGFDVYGDFDERLEAYARLGVGVLMNGRSDNRCFAYLDTEASCGVILELIKRGGPRKFA